MPETPQIKHFHTAQPDPYRPGHWYLSSGDDPDQSHVWLSKDDGKTWTEVTDPHPVGTTRLSVHRYTAPVFTEDYIYWATDDLLGVGQAQVVRATRGEPLKVQTIGGVGDECVRNIVLTDYGMLLISEAREHKDAGVNIYLYTRGGRVIPIRAGPRGEAEGHAPHHLGPTASLSSKVTVNDEFFVLDGTNTRGTSVTRTYLWRITKE
jgi:hypothetical protein